MHRDAGRPLKRRLVSAGEMALVVLWALLVVGLTALPYLWAIAHAPEGHQFQGFIWGVDEGNVYLAWTRQAAEGRLLLRNQYTALPQNPHFFNIFLQGLGRVTALARVQPAVVFHGARLLGGLVLLTSVYLLAACLTRSVATRWAALALASLGSGVGWLAAIWAQSRPEYLPPPLRPPDYAPLPPQTWQVMPEAVTFLSLLLNPLFVWSMSLLCAVMIGAVLALERGDRRWAVATGVLLLLLGNVHTYDVFVVHGTILLFALLLVAMRRISLSRALTQYAIIFVIALPSPVWAWYASQQDPAYLEKINTKTLSPPPLDFAAGYGLILVLAVVGGCWVVRRREETPRLLLPVAWVVANAALLYAPVSFQRKMAEGLHIPLCMLAGVGLVEVLGRRWLSAPGAKGRAALLIALAVVLALPSNVLFVDSCLHHVASNNRDLLYVLQPPIYLTFDEVRAIRYLGRTADETDVVLCSSLTGSHIPPRARCTVFAGHWAETLHFGDAVNFIGEFLIPGRSAKVLRAAIEQIGADYVVYGPREALIARQIMLAAGLTPPDDPAAQFRETTAGFLREVFSSGDVSVYRVRPDGAAASARPR